MGSTCRCGCCRQSLTTLFPQYHPAAIAWPSTVDLRWVPHGRAALWPGDQVGTSLGAPAYHPRALLSVWSVRLPMTGVPSCPKLEAALFSGQDILINVADRVEKSSRYCP